MECIDYVAQANKLKEEKNYKAAIEMLYKALETEQDNVEILSQIGELYFLINNYERAQQYFEKTLQLNSKELSALKYLSKIRRYYGDMNGVLELTQKIFDIYPNSENLKDLVKILMDLKLFCEVEKYINSQYFDDSVKIEYATCLYLNGEKEKAVELLKECNPDDEKVLLLQGKIKFDNNEFEQAKEIFNRIGKNSQNAEILNYLGLYEIDAMNFTNAIKDFSKAIAINKQNPVYYFNLGNAYFYNGWMQEAQKAYRSAIELDPVNNDYRYALAYLYYDNKEYKKAENEINAISDSGNINSRVQILKAMLLAQKKDLIGAKKLLEEINSDDNYTKSALSKIYAQLNIFHKAEQLSREVLESSPDNIDYMNDLAEIYLQEKKYNEAYELALKILEINPNYINASILAAKAAFLNEDYETSKQYAQEAISLDMNCAQGYYYLALVREKTQDPQEAVECMKRAILYDLNNAQYYVKMSELYKAQKDYKTALEYISEAENIAPSNEYKSMYSELVKLNRRNVNK